MGECLSRGSHNLNTETGQNSNSKMDAEEECKLADAAHETSSPIIMSEATKVSQKEIDIFPSFTKMTAMDKESAPSFADFCNPAYIRDQTACKETFRAIEAEGD